MMLLADFRADGARMAAVPARGRATWVAASERDAAIGLFARLERAVPGLRAKLRTVVLVEGTADRATTWSSVRAGVAFANALAFALSIPAVGVAGDGAWTREQMEAAARAAAASTNQRNNGRIRASYNAEPNITTPNAQ